MILNTRSRQILERDYTIGSHQSLISGRYQIPRNGLVGEWKLDGDAVDSSGYGYNGTSTNVTWTGTDMGYQGKKGVFGGTGAYVTIPDSSSFWNGKSLVTLSCWIYQTSLLDTTNSSIYISGPGGFWLGSYSALSGNNGFGVNTGSWTFCNATSAFPINKWCHIVGTYDGVNLKIYIDGELNNTTAKTGTIGASAGTGTIGAYTGLSSVGPTGNIQLVRTIYGVLSQSQIKLLYKEGLKLLH